MTSGVALRIATTADTRYLAGVQLSSALAGFAHIFPSSIPKPTQPELEDEWAALLADTEVSIVVAVADDLVCGVVASSPDRTGRYGTDCLLRKLYVAPDHEGHGIGGALHDRALADLEQAHFSRARLWVLERNIVARRMYERRGWKLEPWTQSDWPGSGILEVGYSRLLGYSSAI